ncbi:phosphoribosylformylglycinamidine cyclo-ligase [candidate division LCP-89 bacterium B3_LCP]|uniref:Phosphoribosylformylglycinamidine cyclo-ligase n=1 Tax=candidate division LCP-89 bacterium B3_LCP TaxID=2012998 RepID=A0A532V5X4_UNCL8|nr:MAG: phosphoribosylformylglycinamidine cyclo-ligase [candidate division LCP-89 bacterium B3_LCP]
MPIDYKSSGVNLKAADEALKRIKSLVKTTRTPQVIGDVGLFAGAFRLPIGKKSHPVLLASTDGVGTKLKVAFLAGKYDTVGKDLVNHCVNDLLANGADPLFFLDYYGCGRLNPDVQVEVISGFTRACKANGIALLGGETAEMPGFYQDDEFDLAGTIIGWADEDDLILGKRIEKGDVILGFPSIGLHTNGYSLARRVLLDEARLGLDEHISELGCTLADCLLKVHPSYLEAIRAVRRELKIKGIAHITGGGIEGNLRRVVSKEHSLKIHWGNWQVPPIFDLIEKLGPVETDEMRRVFNMGVGMALVVSPDDANRIASKEFASWKIFEVGRVI